MQGGTGGELTWGICASLCPTCFQVGQMWDRWAMLNSPGEATHGAFDATLLAQVQGHIEHGLELSDATFDRCR